MADERGPRDDDERPRPSDRRPPSRDSRPRPAGGQRSQGAPRGNQPPRGNQGPGGNQGPRPGGFGFRGQDRYNDRPRHAPGDQGGGRQGPRPWETGPGRDDTPQHGGDFRQRGAPGGQRPGQWGNGPGGRPADRGYDRDRGQSGPRGYDRGGGQRNRPDADRWPDRRPDHRGGQDSRGYDRGRGPGQGGRPGGPSGQQRGHAGVDRRPYPPPRHQQDSRPWQDDRGPSRPDDREGFVDTGWQPTGGDGATPPTARHEPPSNEAHRPPRGAIAAGAAYGAARGGRPGYAPVSRRPPAPSLERLALGDDEELVAGRRPVEEAFVARREARRLLVVPQRRMALEKLVLHATSLRIPVVEVEGGSLTAIAGFDGHQGVALVVAPRRWAAPDDILALARQRDEAPLVLVLDSLEDPQNVGTLLRTAEAQGVHGAIFPTHRQAPLTPAAVKASAGAVEHLQLAPVDDLAGALADLHSRGLRIVGADGDAPLTAHQADLRGPIAIVVGSEGRGLGPAVRRRCDLLVRIPMHGRIDSLNAAVAGSILLYEAAAQRGLVEAQPQVDPHAAPPEAADAAADAPPVDALPAAAEAASDADTADTGDTPLAPEEPPVGKPKRRVAPKRPSASAVEAGAPQTEASASATPDVEPEPKRRRSSRAAAPATSDAEADELLPGGPSVDIQPVADDGAAEPAETPREV